MGRGAFLRRLLLVPPTLFGVAVVVFVLLRVVPGNPVAMVIPPGASQADVDRLMARYGLDFPLLDQFVVWLRQVLVGDFGTSISRRQDVMTLILGRLPATLELVAIAILVALAVGAGLALGSSSTSAIAKLVGIEGGGSVVPPMPPARDRPAQSGDGAAL